MLKKLNIDLYLDGYNYAQVNCVELPIAAACGSYNKNNYFYYSFYYSLYNNYGNEVIHTDRILNNIGLKLVAHTVHKKDQLLNLIFEKIDLNIPIVFISKYSELFWCKSFVMAPLKHAFLINGYWKEENIIIVRDSFIVNKFSNKGIDDLIKASPMYEFSITEDMVSDIFEKNLEIGENESLYSVEIFEEHFTFNMIDMIKDSIEFLKQNNDSLTFIINNLHKFKITSVESLRKKYYYGFEILFDILEKFFLNNSKFTCVKNNYLNLKDRYIKYRGTCVQLICKQIIKNEEIKDEKKQEITNTLNDFKNKFIELLCKMYNICLKDQNTIIELKNYALNAQVSADSEYSEYKSIKASNAVNGRKDDWRYDMWISNPKNTPHWLKLDIGEPKPIVKIIIKHNADKPYLITKDFKIQGSNDDIEWITLINVKNNIKGITEYNLENCKFRFFRLYITKACDNDCQAAIYEFEVWGKDL